MGIDLILLLLVVVVSYANGSNDISKGIATLIGSGASDYNQALLWGTLCTTAGTLVAAWFSTALVDTFLGGLTLTAAPVAVTAFAILVAASLWVLLATRTGLPVSTTHAIAGAMIGMIIFFPGVSREGALVQLGLTIAVPLLASPIAGFFLAWGGDRFFRKKLEEHQSSCICMTTQPATIIPALAYQRSTANTRFSHIEQNVYPVNMRVVGGKTDECVSSPSIISRVDGFLANAVTAGLVLGGAPGLAGRCRRPMFPPMLLRAQE